MLALGTILLSGFFFSNLHAQQYDPTDGWLKSQDGQKAKVWLNRRIKKTSGVAIPPFSDFYHAKQKNKSSSTVTLYTVVGNRLITSTNRNYISTNLRPQMPEGDETNPIKGLLANFDTQKSGFNSRVVIYDSPAVGTNKKLIAKENLALVYIYQRENDWILIGERENLFDGPHSILGWVKKGSWISWESNFALQFNQQNVADRQENLARIFPTFKEAEQCFEEQSPAFCEKASYDREFPIDWDSTRPRHPILGLKESNGNWFYQIAYSSGLDRTKGIPAETNCQNTMVASVDESVWDVVFLLDGTASFYSFIIQYIDVVDLISRFKQSIDLKIGLALYRDKNKVNFHGRPNPRPWKAYPLTSDFNSIKEKFEDEAKLTTTREAKIGAFASPPARWGVRNVLEQYFKNKRLKDSNGHAAETSGVRANSKRYIILMGDHGNRLEPGEINDLERYINKNMAPLTNGGGLLVLHRNNIRKNRKTGRDLTQEIMADQVFRDYFADVTIHQKSRHIFQYIELGQKGSDGTEIPFDNVKIEINSFFEKEVKQKLAGGTVFDNWKKTEVPSPSVVSPTAGLDVLKQIRRRGVSAQQSCQLLAELSEKNYQTFKMGWVPQINPLNLNKQVEVVNLMTKQTVQDVYDTLSVAGNSTTEKKTADIFKNHLLKQLDRIPSINATDYQDLDLEFLIEPAIEHGVITRTTGDVLYRIGGSIELPSILRRLPDETIIDDSLDRFSSIDQISRELLPQMRSILSEDRFWFGANKDFVWYPIEKLP